MPPWPKGRNCWNSLKAVAPTNWDTFIHPRNGVCVHCVQNAPHSDTGGMCFNVLMIILFHFVQQGTSRGLQQGIDRQQAQAAADHGRTCRFRYHRKRLRYPIFKQVTRLTANSTGNIERWLTLPKTRDLDFMNILSYDYHSAFEPQVNHHAPLRSLTDSRTFDPNEDLNVVSLPFW